jgi:septal ring factor EnvC (AmiA/AmiB activator)
LSALPGSQQSGGVLKTPLKQSKSASELLLDLEGLLLTLKTENATSLTASDERVLKLTQLAEQLRQQVAELQTSKVDSAELKAAFDQLSTDLVRLSQMLSENQMIAEGLKSSLTQLSESFADYKKSSDADIRQAKADAATAKRSAVISIVVAGVGLGAATGLAIAGPVGAAVGAGIGAVLAIVLHPG